MYPPTLPAGPRPPALAPLRHAQSIPRRTQTFLLDGMFRGELDEVLPRLPAFDRVPFAALGGIDNQFLDAIVRREEPGRGLPAVPVAIVSMVRPPDKGGSERDSRERGGVFGKSQKRRQTTVFAGA